jgi:hypothetical protein
MSFLQPLAKTNKGSINTDMTHDVLGEWQGGVPGQEDGLELHDLAARWEHLADLLLEFLWKIAPDRIHSSS